MSINGESDWRGLTEAGRIVRRVLEEMGRQVRPGVTTGDLDRVAGRVLAAEGARHAPRFAYDFPGDACISVNDEAVHGIPGGRVLEAGDLVKLDVVAEKDGYLADAAITVAVPPIPEAHRRLLATVHAAFEAGLLAARAGGRVNDIGRAIEREVTRRGHSVIRELTGHGIGRRIHEAPAVPNYYDPACGQPLTEGLVITIEPIVASGLGLCVQDADGWTCRTADGSAAAHYEHTLVVTRGRPVLLTAA
jgi:methionyl aminopeptidase